MTKLDRVQGPSLRVSTERTMISSTISSSSVGKSTGTMGEPFYLRAPGMAPLIGGKNLVIGAQNGFFRTFDTAGESVGCAAGRVEYL